MIKAFLIIASIVIIGLLAAINDVLNYVADILERLSRKL